MRNAEDHPTSHSDFDYPIEEQVIPTQLGHSPQCGLTLTYLLYLMIVIIFAGGIVVRNYQQMQKVVDILRSQFIYPIVFVLSLKSSLWLTAARGLQLKILQKLCIANLK